MRREPDVLQKLLSQSSAVTTAAGSKNKNKNNKNDKNVDGTCKLAKNKLNPPKQSENKRENDKSVTRRQSENNIRQLGNRIVNKQRQRAAAAAGLYVLQLESGSNIKNKTEDNRGMNTVETENANER
jgi:hypothetical protein